MTEHTGHPASRPRRVAAFLFGNWPARGYLAVVSAAALFLLGAELTEVGDGPSFAGIYLIGATLPGSLLFAPLYALGPQWLTQVLFVIGTTVSALANTAVISLVVRSVRASRSTRPAG